MATVTAPFCSFLAKGKFGDLIVCQPKPYTKGPASRESPTQFAFEVAAPKGTKSKIIDFLFPISGWISEKCDMERVMRVLSPLPNYLPAGMTSRMSFSEWAKLQQLAFQEARALFNTLTEQQKTSWTIFGHQFIKQDICTLALVPVTGFEIFMSMKMLFRLVGFADSIVKTLWAPVMDPELSEQAARKSWEITESYYQMKKASLRRAWVLYRHHEYTIQQVMSITQSWASFNKWKALKLMIMEAADAAWVDW